jgi:hypothetical protein
MNDIEFLKAVVAYIERWEIEADEEWGEGRTLDQLKMPQLYAEAKERLAQAEAIEEI